MIWSYFVSYVPPFAWYIVFDLSCIDSMYITWQLFVHAYMYMYSEYQIVWFIVSILVIPYGTLRKGWGFEMNF